MTTEFAVQPAGIDPDVSASLQIYERIKPLKDALGVRDLTDQELQVFALVARYTGLDPFTKQIYAIKRAGRVTHQTGIDGYRSTAERTGQYAGSDEALFEDCPCGAEPKGHPSVARVTVHRIHGSGHVIDQVGVARWHELYPGAGDVGQMWRKMPHNQLAKCAEANGLRKAFPRVLGGVYLADEMQGADTIEGEAREVPEKAAPVTVADRIAARRAAVEPPAIVVDPTPQEAASEPSVETGIEAAGTAEDASDEATASPGAEPDAAGASSPKGTANPSPSDRCSSESPYGDGATCGLLPAHKGLHRQLDVAGVVVGSWPDR
jgi:phage recombination protein Bet